MMTILPWSATRSREISPRCGPSTCIQSSMRGSSGARLSRCGVSSCRCGSSTRLCRISLGVCGARYLLLANSLTRWSMSARTCCACACTLCCATATSARSWCAPRLALTLCRRCGSAATAPSRDGRPSLLSPTASTIAMYAVIACSRLKPRTCVSMVAAVQPLRAERGSVLASCGTNMTHLIPGFPLGPRDQVEP